VAIHQVRLAMQGALRRGMDEAQLLHRAGISPLLLESGLSRVTVAQYARLLTLLRRVTRDELWGLCATPLPVGSFAQVIRYALSARTLGDAMRRGFTGYHLLLGQFVPRLRVQGDVASVRMVTRGTRDAALEYAERVFGYFCYGVICWLVARRVPMLRVVYAPPAGPGGAVSDAEQLFHAPLYLDMSYSGFDFEARWLDLPVVQTASSLHEFLRAAPAALITKYREQGKLADRVRRLLRNRLAAAGQPGLPDVDESARQLDMAAPTLRRHLSREGTSFQQLKDELRRDAAIALLTRTELSLLDIGLRLGFSEASTFHRAFKGWTGVAPGVYRQARL
jgi:AraC-like DNA-binding protein